MHDAVELKQVPEQPMAVVRGSATMATLPSRIRELFDQFYAGFKSKGELNIVFYPGDVAGEFEIACGVQIEHGGTLLPLRAPSRPPPIWDRTTK
jgi:hypothetical protein